LGSPTSLCRLYRDQMVTPLPVAKALLAFTSILLAMAILVANPFLLFWSVVAVVMAGLLVGKAVKS
jgi:hypothetical protein